MKIVYVHAANMAIPSANTLQVARMCDAFARGGASVSLWYPTYSSRRAVADWQAHYGVRERIDARPLRTALTERIAAGPLLPALKMVGYAQLVAQFRLQPRERPDVLYTRCFAAAAFFPPALAAVFGGRRPRVVFEAHELPPTPSRMRALRNVDRIVAITEAAARDIADEIDFERDRILVAPDGVPGAWLDDPISRSQARALLRLSADRPLAVYTGTFQPATAKRLRAIALQLPEVDVLAVGRGADDARRSIEPVANLFILDPVDAHVARLYQAAGDVLVMPHDGTLRWSKYTSPLKLFEYMAAGRPIVASHLPVLEEVVRHGQHAWLVPIGDDTAFASAVRTMTRDHAAASSLGDRARAAVRQYTWEARAAAIVKFASAQRTG